MEQEWAALSHVWFMNSSGAVGDILVFTFINLSDNIHCIYWKQKIVVVVVAAVVVSSS